MQHLAQCIDGWARMDPLRPALHFEGETWTYARLSRDVARLAAVLAGPLGVAPGDRVAFLGQNHPLQIMLLFAVARLGAILLPLNWRLAPPEHAYILNNAEVKVLVADPTFVGAIDTIRNDIRPDHFVTMGAAARAGWQALDALLDAQGDATAAADGAPEREVLIAYTSGTTGRPKGALLTQDNIFHNAVNSIVAHDMTSRDRILTLLPMFHLGGFNIQTVPALHAGAEIWLHRTFDPAAVMDTIAAERITLTLMVPAVMRACLAHPAWPEADFSSLRMVSAGSSIIPAALIEPFHARGLPVTQVYGGTETGPVATFLRPEHAMDQVGSCGRPAIWSDIRIVDDEGQDLPTGSHGELLVRGPMVIRRYWRDEAATQDSFDGDWFRTGDIGYYDSNGFLWIADRKTDVITSGGENIYPAELEMVLEECPGLEEFAVVQRPDDHWGEVPVAVVVRRKGSGIDRVGVLALFEGRLGHYKHPKDVIFLDELPRTALGKVQKDRLRAFVKKGKPGAG